MIRKPIDEAISLVEQHYDLLKAFGDWQERQNIAKASALITAKRSMECAPYLSGVNIIIEGRENSFQDWWKKVIKEIKKIE